MHPLYKIKRKWKVGTFVWGKMNKKYWPGIIINHKEINFSPPKDNFSLLFWFGEHKVSPISNSNIVDFCKEFTYRYKTNSRMPKSYLSAVIEAIKVVGSLDDNIPDNEVISWAKLNLESIDNHNDDIPDSIRRILQELYFDEEDVQKKLEPEYTKKRKNLHTKLLIEKYRSGIINSLDICLGCYTNEITADHPIFQGKICNTCRENIKERYYIIGIDEIRYCCTICSNLGEVLVCDRPGCRFVYCFVCVDEFASPGARKEILGQSNWYCFVCDKATPLKGTLIVRENWRQNITDLYGMQVIPPVPIIKRRIRVLSLFDGIGTGLTCLWNLKISIEKYYTCEIDTDCIDVVEKNYPSGPTLLGDIKSLTQNRLQTILPIDLLLGGSPCNDLSAANPNRRGLYDPDGSGVLFFDFHRIMMTIKMYNQGRHLFWLYENVSSMSPESKHTITRFLGCEPMIIDAAWVSAMRRPRLFWGNLPSIAHQDLIANGPHLQTVLLPGRKANVDKLQTVTTKSNSLLQGPGMKLPVINKDGTEDYLHITELEAVFGFPRNYTAINDFSPSRRQQLIGKAWSVPVITMLLSCLTDYFDNEDY